MKALLSAVVFGLVLAVRPASAHHLFGVEFDIDKPISLQGTITKWTG